MSIFDDASSIMNASGPAYPDSATAAQVLAIVEKYHLTISASARSCLLEETPKALENAQSIVTGSVRQLCAAAAKSAAASRSRTMTLITP